MGGESVDESSDVLVDSGQLSDVLESYPIQCAVLFGSHVHGSATTDSDVDIAVAFEERLSASERLERRVALTSDFMEALGTNDVDVADLDDIRPEVGLDALRTGTVLVGEPDVIETYRDQFERAIGSDDDTHADRMRRFDGILDRLEGRV